MIDDKYINVDMYVIYSVFVNRIFLGVKLKVY